MAEQENTPEVKLTEEPEKVTCTKCLTPKIPNDFPSNGDGKGGKRKQCKECMKEINKKWRKENAERVVNYNKNRRR